MQEYAVTEVLKSQARQLLISSFELKIGTTNTPLFLLCLVLGFDSTNIYFSLSIFLWKVSTFLCSLVLTLEGEETNS